MQIKFEKCHFCPERVWCEMAEAKRAAVVLPPPQDEAVLGIVVYVRFDDDDDDVLRNFCRVPREWLDGITTQTAVVRVNSDCGQVSFGKTDNEAVCTLAARFVNKEIVTDYDERLLWPDAMSRVRTSTFNKDGDEDRLRQHVRYGTLRKVMAENDDPVSLFFAPIGCVPLIVIDGNEPKTDKTLFILQTYESE